jgi:hypothetical protein
MQTLREVMGYDAVWARSGDELFYVAADRTVQSVRVDGSSSWRSSTPMKALQGDYFTPGNPTFSGPSTLHPTASVS